MDLLQGAPISAILISLDVDMYRTIFAAGDVVQGLIIKELIQILPIKLPTKRLIE